MIGSAGANVGKTELACELIRRLCKDNDIIGVKVTTIREKNGQCPRGGVGCGVCSSLDGNFDISRETDSGTQKDTARLLAAGAKEVYWLRVLKKHLDEGLSALLDVTGADAVSICESNSLRQVVEPGLFLMVKGSKQQVPKDSAQAVMRYADRIIVSERGGFDLSLDRIKLVNGRWKLAEQATAIILAGGKSGRMGTSKAMLKIKGRTMIEIIIEQLEGNFDRILVSANEPERFKFLKTGIVPDEVAGRGPLMGIASALEASRSKLNFIIACDIPFVDVKFVRKMIAEARKSGAQIIIPQSDEQKNEPLFAVYHKSTAEPMRQILSQGARKISDVFEYCNVKFIKLEKELVNINTVDQYNRFRAGFDNED